MQGSLGHQTTVFGDEEAEVVRVMMEGHREEVMISFFF
jgi:hypothetical protein